MEKQYEDNLNDLLVDKRKRECFPNKLQKFKPPLVRSKDFPSRVSLIKSSESELGELQGLTSDNNLLSQKPKKPPITYWRRAESSDIEAITKLIEKCDFPMNDLFGEPDVPNLIEKSTFTIVQFNSKEELISFTSAFSYPDIPAVPSFEWYPWLEFSYRIKDATPRNCFFIHYMVWKPEYYYEFLRLTLETMFLEYTFLNHIIITKPPKVKIPNIILENFIQVLPQDAKVYDCDRSSLQTVLLCLRYSLLERLKIRMAIVEDHDDLMPIVQQHSGRLRELYGEFCMAEIIEFPGTKDRKTLVCESQGYAVGLMIVNRAIDFELLNSQFDLGVFHGLKKPSDRDKISEVVDEDAEGTEVYLPEKIDPFLEEINSETLLKFLNWQPSLCVSEEDLKNVSISSEESIRGYNNLGSSMSDLVRETLNVKLVPKFSAHSLSFTSEEEFSTHSIVSTESYKREDSTLSEESHVQSEPSLVSLWYYNLPTYNGLPNAFCIEFYAMNNNFDDRLCHDFLQATFEVFPDLEYCVMTIPSQSPTFPLLDLFTRVTPRPLKRFKQELYVCHKSSIMITFMRVRGIVKSDLEEIYKLLTGIKNKECIYADIASSCFYEDSAYRGFVLICSKSIVGVAVLCNEYGMEYLAQHYHVSDFIDFELHKIDYHAILKHLVLSPIYQGHARFFLRDIMRMADVTSLYRTRYEEAESNWNAASLITCIGQLIPIKPRRMVKYHEPSLGPNVPPSHFLHDDIPFSLYHINSRACGLKKFTSNTKLVIVGASKTAFAFLESLLFGPSSAYVLYSNVVLVSPHGMGTELPSHPARDLLFPSKGKFTKFYKIQMCFKTYVNFVYGIMTKINRVEKYILINNDSIIPYDYLILLCGRQFVTPVPLSMMRDQKECRRNYRPRCTLYKYLMTQRQKEENIDSIYPPNMFLVNTEVDATNAFISLQYLISKRKGVLEEEKIIIYGHNISTYLCTQGLLKFGIAPHMIVIVEPFPLKTRSVSCFRDENIDTAVLENLKNLNIEHYRGYVLFDWILSSNNQICFATFHSEHRKVTIKCLAMFPFERKLVSDVTFKAVNEASLVYDGRLVINSNFQTNDPHIYAAGSLTKYKRKYYAYHQNHRDYSSSEVGKHLADILRKKIDPIEKPNDNEEISDLVPNMTKPLILFGMLPGDWYYLSIRKPGKFEDPESKAAKKAFKFLYCYCLWLLLPAGLAVGQQEKVLKIKHQGDVLITGDCQMTNNRGYFKLMIDEFGYIEGIFCFTKDEIDTDNLESLYGKHEKLLNDLIYRFDCGMIQDFYSYFREPWVYAVYHDKFHWVLQKNNELFYNEKCSTYKEKIIDMVVDVLKANNWKRPSKEKLEEIKEKFENSDVKDLIIGNILDFLYYFDEPFPMYATPRILRVLLQDYRQTIDYKTGVHNSSASSKPAIRISEMVSRV